MNPDFFHLPSLPLRSFTRLVLRVVDRTLGLPVLGMLQLIHVMIALSGAAAIGSVRDATAAAKHKERKAQEKAAAAVEMAQKALGALGDAKGLAGDLGMKF